MRNSAELPTKTPRPTDEEGSPKRKAAELPKNVILRGHRHYIRIPGKAASKERVRVATFISAGSRGAQAAAALLTQVELLTSILPPRWDLLNALHDGMLSLSEFNELMITRGISAVEERVAAEVRRRQADRSLLALASEGLSGWYAPCSPGRGPLAVSKQGIRADVTTESDSAHPRPVSTGGGFALVARWGSDGKGTLMPGESAGIR